MADETPGAGHNRPPSRVDQLRQEILERHHHLPARTAELMDTANTIPEVIPEDEAPKVTDFIKAITAQVKAINGARVAEKEQFLEGSRIVDGIFKNMSEPLEKKKQTIESRLGVVLRKKEERQRREATERAAADREAAEQRRRDAEEEQRVAREAADKARREAEAAERKAREEQEAADREIREVQERREKAERDSQDLKRKRDRERAAEKEREERERLEALAEEREEAERKAKQDQAEKDRVARKAERVANRADIDVERAEKQENRSVALERKVETAKPAEFARTRGEFGGVGTLQRKWSFANINRGVIDLEKLRHFIPVDGLEKAVRGFIDAGNRECAGVDIFEDDKPNVR